MVEAQSKRHKHRRAEFITYRFVETGRRKDKWRVVREPRDVDVVFVNLVERAHHLMVQQ